MKNNKLVEFKTDFMPIAVLFLLPILYLHEALFHTNYILGSPFTDITLEGHSKLFAYKELSGYSIPLWNPYKFGGMPYLAAPGNAFLYPFHLICLLLPVNFAINWIIAIHLFFSGTFTYYLLKNYGVNRFGSTVAGIVYVFSAPQVMHIYAGHLIAMTTMPWTPLMLLFLDRFVRSNDYKYGIFLSITISIQLLSGYTQYLFYSIIALSFYLLFLLYLLRANGVGWSKVAQKGAIFAVFVAFGLMLSAVQIVPTMEMVKNSTREKLSYEWVSSFSFPPENFITFLIPDFFGDMLKVQYWGKNFLWEMSAYVGVMPLLLAGISIFYARNKRVWFFTFLIIFSIVLALGKHTPLLRLLYNHVPGFNLFRGNSKFIFLTSLSISVLSGFGAGIIADEYNTLKEKRFKIGFSAAVISVIAVMGVMFTTFDINWFRAAINRAVNSGDFFISPARMMQSGFDAAAADIFRGNVIWETSLLVACSAIVLLYSYGMLRGYITKSAIILIIVLDLFSFGRRYMETFDINTTFMDNEVIRFLKKNKEPFRIIAPGMDPNIGLTSGLETLSGYDNIMVKRYSEFINFSQGTSPDKPNLGLGISDVNKLTDLLNARFIVLPAEEKLDSPPFRPVFDDGRNRIYQNMNAFPRAFVVHDTKVINGRDRIFREMESPEFNPASLAVIEEELDMPLNKTTNVSSVPRFMEYSPNRVTMEASLTEPGLLVLGDIYYPGWKAFIDGKETNIYKANYIMRAVALREGRHVVEFRYDPLSFKLGAIISLASFVFVIGFFVFDRRRNEKAEGAVS